MSAVIPFGFDDNLVRVVHNDDGEPLFVARDIALSLGYEWNGSARIAHVPQEWRGVTSVVTPGGKQDVATLTEQGLYFFLGRSDKPKALPFQKWIAGEVLPSIRKRGVYAVGGSSQPERPALPAVPILTDAALGLRPNVRAQVLSCAVQAAKMEGGSPELIDHYFQKYSEMVGATRKPSASDMPKPLDAAALAARERDDTRNLILSWIEDESFEIPRHAVRKHREQAQPLYWEFTQWCRSRGEEFIPGAHGWGREMKKVFPHKLSNVMYYYLVRPECQSATLPIPKPDINPRHN